MLGTLFDTGITRVARDVSFSPDLEVFFRVSLGDCQKIRILISELSEVSFHQGSYSTCAYNSRCFTVAIYMYAMAVSRSLYIKLYARHCLYNNNEI